MEARKQFSRIGWAFVVFCLVDVLVQIVMGVVISIWVRQGSSKMPEMDLMLLGQMSMYVFAFPVFWLMMKRIPSWRKQNEEKMTTGQLLLWVVVCFGFTYIGNVVGQLLMSGVETFTGNPQENPVFDVLDDMNPWMVFLTTVIIAPVMEELMFRKFLIDRIVPFGQRTAVVVSGLAFGLFHGNFYQFFYAFCLGMIFAYIYSSTGRVRYGIMLHMMINLMGGVIPVVLMQGMDGFSAETVFSVVGIFLLGLLMLGSTIGAIVLACIYVRKLTWFQGWAPVPEKGLCREILTAPGVIGFLAVCVLLFALSQ
ncbi:MAG: CPBP family intramembrane metalloprotease [Lachnospiraceae bacterium]|jgi:membrane protease YdiL (CAAX protease family)|nr:CPBP family intramembrane metalloprotease [Lachnospiraceae bacterium]